MQYSEKLKYYRKLRGLSQKDVLEYFETQGYLLGKSGYSHWETGRTTPNADQLLLLCRLFGIDNPLEVFLPDYQAPLNEIGMRKLEEYKLDLIASGRYKPQKSHRPMRPLYLLPVSAGTGQFLDGDAYEMIELEEGISEKADYAVRIAGDSMEPKYHDGGKVWVLSQNSIEDGEIGVFYLNGDAYIKKFERSEKGIRLVSLNTSYAPIEVSDTSDFRVFGKVID